MTTFVYAHIGRDDRVLYVGKTCWPEKRTVQHRSSAWWPEIEAVEIAGIGTAAEMTDLERRLIETFDPPHNDQYTTAWRERCRPSWARPTDAPVDEAHVAELISKGFTPEGARRNARRLDVA